MFYERNLFIILANRGVSHESNLNSNLQPHLINSGIKKNRIFFCHVLGLLQVIYITQWCENFLLLVIIATSFPISSSLVLGAWIRTLMLSLLLVIHKNTMFVSTCVKLVIAFTIFILFWLMFLSLSPWSIHYFFQA